MEKKQQWQKPKLGVLRCSDKDNVARLSGIGQREGDYAHGPIPAPPRIGRSQGYFAHGPIPAPF